MKSEIYYEDVNGLFLASENSVFAQKGDGGILIVALQSMLNCYLDRDARIAVDGVFGSATENIVNKFKKEIREPQNGIVDLHTLAMIMKG